jgi:hypothetical protein
MQSLKFKQLLVISNPTKSANQFDFQRDLTIITADDNNFGKSTLGKLLYWSMGCEPDFDTNWKSLDCRTILKFTVGNVQYETMRYKSYICLNENGSIKIYPKITGEFSDRIGAILKFHALMPKRDTFQLETPPPAFFFVPYYIDQKKSWANAWENFTGLSQYQRWKPTIIKYHIGLLTKEHFEKEIEKYQRKHEKALIELQINKLESTLEVVSNFISEPLATIDQLKLKKMTDEIRLELVQLSDFQEKTLNELTRVEGDSSFLNSQKIMAEGIIKELEKDYLYAVEYFDDDHLECPLCGTNHDNSVVNRASILTDKQQAELQLEQIIKSLSETEQKREKLRGKLDKTRTDIDLIHSKYVIEEGEESINLNSIIENIAGNSIKENVLEMKAQELLSSKSKADAISKLTKEQNEILSNEQKEDINNLFLTTFSSYLELLNADDINTSAVASPLDYAKIVKEGGAAEGARGILAYYLTVHTLIENSENEVIAPLLIDTPNQQEQSLGNYDKILELIKKKVSPKSQIILCALKNEKLDILKDLAHVINLDDKKLLNNKQYDDVSKEFERYRLDEVITAEVIEDDHEDDSSEIVN